VLSSPSTKIDPRERRHDRNALWLFIIAILSTLAIGFQNCLYGYAASTSTARLCMLSFKAVLRQDIEFFDQDENSVSLASIIVLMDQANKKVHKESAQLACEAADSIRTVPSLTCASDSTANAWKSHFASRTGLAFGATCFTHSPRLKLSLSLPWSSGGVLHSCHGKKRQLSNYSSVLWYVCSCSNLPYLTCPLSVYHVWYNSS